MAMRKRNIAVIKTEIESIRHKGPVFTDEAVGRAASGFVGQVARERITGLELDPV